MDKDGSYTALHLGLSNCTPRMQCAARLHHRTRVGVWVCMCECGWVRIQVHGNSSFCLILTDTLHPSGYSAQCECAFAPCCSSDCASLNFKCGALNASSSHQKEKSWEPLCTELKNGPISPTRHLPSLFSNILQPFLLPSNSSYSRKFHERHFLPSPL